MNRCDYITGGNVHDTAVSIRALDIPGIESRSSGDYDNCV